MLRLRNGGLTSKNGFSVVAPIIVSVPSSTAGSNASCCALLNRWISSRNRIVPRPCSPIRWRARSITSRTSLIPALTALICSKTRLVLPATASANVVLPVPGGPQKIALVRRSCSTSSPQRLAGADEVLLADDVVERARPQAGRQRRVTAQMLLGRGGEEIAHSVPSTRLVGGAAELDDVVDQPLRARPTSSRRTRCRPGSARRRRAARRR